MIAVFLQARIDSSRLPAKALLPLAGKPTVQVVMERLRRIPADTYVLLTDSEGKSAFTPLADLSGFQVFEGPKLDVLGRFCQAIRTYKPETVIRATADNPLVSWELANQILDEHRSLKAEYSAMHGMPVGLGVEVVQASALLQAESESQDSYDREHVTPYLYRNPDRFYLHRPLVPENFRGRQRVTVDTLEDYQRMVNIFRRIGNEGPIDIDHLIPILREEFAS